MSQNPGETSCADILIHPRKENCSVKIFALDKKQNLKRKKKVLSETYMTDIKINHLHICMYIKVSLRLV